jgi:CBS domain containing-hemolysin-like protein
MIVVPAAALLLVLAFLFSGLEAAWIALDRVRLQHRAAKNEGRARQMLAWDAAAPQADLVMAWTSRLAAAGAFVLLAAKLSALGAPVWLAPLVFVPVYALVVQLLARQVFRRLPFKVLSASWWIVSLAGSFWSVLARPVAALLRCVPREPLSRAPAAEELMTAAVTAPEISALELGMLRSVLDFRRLTAGGLARPVGDFPHAPADLTLGALLSDRALAEARHALITGPDGLPLGALACGSAALSGAPGARVQSFARPLLSFPGDLPGWKVLAKLRRAPTPVAEVHDEETGRFLGIITEESVVARLLGQTV